MRQYGRESVRYTVIGYPRASGEKPVVLGERLLYEAAGRTAWVAVVGEGFGPAAMPELARAEVIAASELGRPGNRPVLVVYGQRRGEAA